MQILGHLAGQLAQLGDRSDAAGVLVLAAPHRERRAPVPLARQRPVDVVLEPLAEAAVLDVERVPLDGLVGREQLVPASGRTDVPLTFRVVEQAGVAAPAMRVGVLVLLGAVDQPARLEVGDQVPVGVLHVASGVGTDALVIRSVGTHRVDHVQPVLLAEAKVVLTERDRRVHESGAIVCGDEVAGQHGVPAPAVLGSCDEGERGLVGGALHLPSGKALDHLGTLSEHRLDACLREHVDLAVLARPDVGELRVHRDGGVRHEGPRRRRPHEQRVAVTERPRRDARRGSARI